MNRKSQKVYTLILTGPQVRALSKCAGIKRGTFSNNEYRAALNAIHALSAVLSKVYEDEKT